MARTGRLCGVLLLVGCSHRPLPLPEAVDDGGLADASAVPAVADLAARDLGSAADLAAPDLAIVDLAIVDLAPADLRRPPLRLLAPLSTSTVTSHRPSLRWEGGAAPVVELCRDRACNQRL